MISRTCLIILFLITSISCIDLDCKTKIPENPEIFEDLEDYEKNHISLKIYSWIEFRQNIVKLEPHVFRKNDSNYIQKLILENKGIRTISAGAFDDLTCLKILNLKLNNINDLTPEYFRNLVNLVALDLSHNQLERIPEKSFEKLGSLLTLDLSHNGIKRLSSNSFEGLISLVELNLESNKILDFPSSIFRPMSGLKRLNLAKNEINVITNPSLEFLENLLEINYSENGITYIYEEMFKALPKLGSIDFSKNQLPNINIRDLKYAMPALTKINIFQNQFECKNVEKILSDLQIFNISVFTGNTIIYPSPTMITTLLPQFNCVEPPKSTETTPASSPDINFFDDSPILAAISNLKSYIVSILVVLLIFGILTILFRAQFFSNFNRSHRGILQFQNSREDLALLQR